MVAVDGYFFAIYSGFSFASTGNRLVGQVRCPVDWFCLRVVILGDDEGMILYGEGAKLSVPREDQFVLGRLSRAVQAARSYHEWGPTRNKS